MCEVSCARCGTIAEGLALAPLPGEVGQRVRGGTCRNCWEAWLKAQVILINENKLSPANPEHYKRLIRDMTAFLNLTDRQA